MGPGWQHSSARTTVAAEEPAARNELRLITDPTGGRLFNVATPEQMSRAFAEIQEELHRQYVLTYYTERQPGEGGVPEVRVKRAGLEVRSAVPLETARVERYRGGPQPIERPRRRPRARRTRVREPCPAATQFFAGSTIAW